MNKKEIKELIRFVQNEENSKDFEDKAMEKYSHCPNSIIDILDEDSSEISETDISHVMTVLDALFDAILTFKNLVEIASKLAKRKLFTDIGKKFALMVAKTGLFYSYDYDEIKTVTNYLVQINLDAETLSILLRSKDYLTDDFCGPTIGFFASKIRKMNHLDIDLVLNKALNNSEYPFKRAVGIIKDEIERRRRGLGPEK